MELLKSIRKENKFRFYVGIDDIVKASDEEGEMIVEGVASTESEDADGEVLLPEGFNVDYFLKSGFINWHHQSKSTPGAIIGEPIEAKVENKEFIVKGRLYPWLQQAKDVYALSKGLASSGSGRKLGWSIEGAAVEREDGYGNKILNKDFDPELHKDYTKVTKAVITGIAITPMPKNGDTYLDVVKGHFTPFEEEVVKEETSKTENGGKVNIIDITKPNGERVVVDSNYNIQVMKAMTTESGASLMTESLEGKEKDLTDKKEFEKAIIILHKACKEGTINKENALKRIKEKFKSL